MSHSNLSEHVDGIAIIGMSCRFPGACSVDQFWHNIRDGVESITFFSDEELMASGIDPTLLNDPNYVRAGFVLENVAQFDASFFGYSPREAEIMDPQQRLFLQCAWESLEDAGYPPVTYPGPIGVFGGAKTSTYLSENGDGTDFGTPSWFQRLIGNDKDYLTSRVSYKLNLKGPSVTVQTACSTSLVAVHLGCESLLNGECDLVLAGGAAITLPQRKGYVFQEGMVLSPDGHCRAFDAEAGGMMGGNGVGIVALKRLEDALRDGDSVHAVIRGTAVNNDGSMKLGYTTPSVEGEAAVIKEAQSVAKVSAESISYIEAHGTGTDMGDPVEVAALTQVFRSQTDKKGFCALGSVKTNIGHLDTAAGVASLIKTVLALRHKQLPPSLYYRKPNPKIDFANSPFFVNKSLTAWKTDGHPRRAGVSSFGFGGTNAHVIVEEAPAAVLSGDPAGAPIHILTLTAKNRWSLEQLAKRYHAYLQNHPDAALDDVCFTTNVGRTHFPYRIAIAAASGKQLRKRLGALAGGGDGPGLARGYVDGEHQPKVAFLFTGQGSQYAGMGEALYAAQPTFREALDRCALILEDYLDRPLLPLMFGGKDTASLLDETVYTQPALFALEYALFTMWCSWGVEPSVVMGHSVGEYVAACVAGVFSLEDGLKLIAARGRLIQAISREGTMAAVRAGEERVAAAIAPYAEDVSLAAINGPENVVLSGLRSKVIKIIDDLSREKIDAVPLRVSHAFHSPLMKPILSDFEKIAATVSYSPPRIGLISNVTGAPVDARDICQAGYWRRHVREPVRFASSVTCLHGLGYEFFLEVGPNPVLSAMGQRCLPEDTGIWLSSLRKASNDWPQVFESLAELYVRGVAVDWSGVHRHNPGRRISLPTYPFNQKRYWIKDTHWDHCAEPPRYTEIWNALVEAGRLRARLGISELNLADQPDNAQTLTRLYAAYAAFALQSIGAFQQASDWDSVDTLLERFPIPFRYRQLVSRLLEGLAAEGRLQRDGTMYGYLTPVQKDTIATLVEDARAKSIFADNPEVINFIQRCGENLGPVLIGRKDPMEVVFPDGAFDMVENLYKHNALSQYYNLILRDIVQKLPQLLRADKRLRILELGGGTGSATEYLLPVLPPERTTYTFTDLSSIFLHRAKQKFSLYPFIEYKLLDIQQPPPPKDFARHTYDLIIAANVLHATRDLNETLVNLRSLLAPLGILLVRELTKPTLLFDIAFGPLLVELVDEELRNGHPLLEVQRWFDLLNSHDFRNVEIFPPADSEFKNPDEHILIAQGPSSLVRSVPPAFSVSAETVSAEGRSEILPDADILGLAATPHPLLGRRLRSALPIFELRLSLNTLPSLKNHRICGETVLSGGAFFEMVFAAGEKIFGTANLVLENITMQEALIIPEKNRLLTVQLILNTEFTNEATYKILSLPDHEDSLPQNWKLHVTGHIRNEELDVKTASAKHAGSLTEIRSLYRDEISIVNFYNTLHARRLIPVDDPVRWIEALWRQDNKALGRIHFREVYINEAKHFRLHPSVLDPCMQVLLSLLVDDDNDTPDTRIYLPVGVDRVCYYGGIDRQMWCHAEIHMPEAIHENGFAVDFHLFDTAGKVVAHIKGLQVRRINREALTWRRERVRNDIFYEVRWQPKAPAELLRKDRPDPWLIFADRRGGGQALADWLAMQGHNCDLVFPATTRAPDDIKTGHSRLDPDDPSGFLRLLQKRQADQDKPYRGVIHLWSLDTVSSGGLTADTLNTSQKLTCTSVLHLIQALAGAGLENSLRLCLVTCGGQPVKPETGSVEVAQTPLWGLRKVLAREHPDLRCRIIDLDPANEIADIGLLGNEIFSWDGEDEVALRGGKRYVPRLWRYTVSSTNVREKVKFCSDGTYLITGGLGGMGVEVAGWLVAQGARHLVLLGRNEASATVMERLGVLEQGQARIRVVRGDVSDEQGLAAVFDQIRSDMPRLRGVFHLAGILEEGSLIRQTDEDLDRIMKPKVAGAWNLHRLTIKLPLDFFVLYSSIASFVGGHGLGGYTAANMFLDALAHHRRSEGLPALSINWGAFSDVGLLAQDEDGSRQRKQFGISAFSPRQALSHLGLALKQEVAQLCVAKIDWTNFFQQFLENGPPFFSALQGDETLWREDATVSMEIAPILRQLRQAPPGQRQELMVDYLKQKIAWGLHLDVEQVTAEGDLIQMGMDSLIFLNLAQVLAKELQIRIVPHEIFTMPTIRQMAIHFSGRIASVPDAAGQEIGAVMNHPMISDNQQRYEPFDLTKIQQAYWIGRSADLELGNVACHTYFEFDNHNLDLERYRTAWQRLIVHHDMLRAIILPDGRQQIIKQVPDCRIAVSDLRKETPEAVKQQLRAVRQQMSHQVLQTDQWPLFEIRASLIDNVRTRIHISLDLLIADADSVVMLMKQLLRLYENPDLALAPIEISFRDYVLAEATFRKKEPYRQAREYWLKRLDDLPPHPDLPLAQSPGDIKQPRFTRWATRLAPDTWLRLKNRAAEAGLTPSGLLISVYAEILGTWAKTRRFTINLTLFNRFAFHPQINDLVGDFTSVTLLEVDNAGKGSFEARAQHLQKQLWNDLEHRYFSGIEVLREIARRNASPSAAVMPVVFTGNIRSGADKQGQTFNTLGELVYNISQTPQVWLDNQAMEDAGALLIQWDVVEGLFPDGLVDAMFEAYGRLLLRLADVKASWRETTCQLLPAHQLDMRAKVNATETVRSLEMLHTLFANQVCRQKDRPAIICADRTVSYTELSHRAGQVGHLLRQKGAQPGTLAAVVMEKGWEQVVAVLGILQSGAAYLPIDPKLPTERRRHLLRDGRANLVLTQSWLAERFEWPERIECFAVDAMTSAEGETQPPEAVSRPDDLAYVIYTSGSTGLPKGVMINHRGAVNTILDVNRRFGVGPEDRVLALSNLNFDLSVYDIFGTLAAGGAIVLPEAAKTKDPAHWMDLIARERVGIWNSVPALMQMLVRDPAPEKQAMLRSLRLILLSGDWIPLSLPDQIKALVKDAKIISLGGATEASIWSILHPIEKVDPQGKSIPYGLPMENQKFHVLNALMENCPDWVPGHLYIEGIGLAKGYWRDKERTNRRFVEHPRTGARLYDTGDLGRYLPDGNIEFLGREDYQVKISGYRIELGEIEAILGRYPGVNGTVVTVVGNTMENRHLVCYLVLQPQLPPSVEDIREFLKEKLPGYMVPASFVVLDAFPLTSNGKIDRQALPAPNHKDVASECPFVAPVTPLEKKIAQQWTQSLNLERVGIHDNFFELGGNSLLAVQTLNMLRVDYRMEMPLRCVFEAPTISALADLVAAAQVSQRNTEVLEEGFI